MKIMVCKVMRKHHLKRERLQFRQAKMDLRRGLYANVCFLNGIHMKSDIAQRGRNDALAAVRVACMSEIVYTRAKKGVAPRKSRVVKFSLMQSRGLEGPPQSCRAARNESGPHDERVSAAEESKRGRVSPLSSQIL